MDLVVLMDSSGSVGNKGFKEEQDFVIELVKSFEIGLNATRVSIINFNSRVNVITDLKSGINKDDLIKKIENIRYNGGKFLYNYTFFYQTY